MAGILGSVVNALKGFGKEVQKKEPNSIPLLKTPYEKINRIMSEFSAAFEFDKANRDICAQNWKMYSGSEYGQWDDDALSKIQAEPGRHAIQLNFVRGKVDGLAGSIIKNWYDIDWIPTDGKYSQMIMDFKARYLEDKNVLSWEPEYNDFVIDFLVYGGGLEMYVDDTYEPLGNIGLRRIMTGHLLCDPNWLTNRSKDMKRAWKLSYLTAEELKNKYKHKSEEIDDQIEFVSKIGTVFDNGDAGVGIPHFNADDRYGSKYKVIEYHHMEQESRKVEIDIATGRMIPEGTDDEKREWCIMNDIDGADGVIQRDYDVMVYYVTSCCPQLDPINLLEDRQHEIQIGRLPFFIASSGRINGKNSGIVDLLYDAQQTINKRESLIDKMIATEANGAMAIDPMIVGNDANQMQKVLANMNNPAYRFWSQPGALASGRNYFQSVPKGQFPQEIVNELGRMLDYVDRLSKQSASSDGRNESSHETGILFARKQMQAEIIQTTLMKALEQIWMEIGDAYFQLGKKLYSGAYREFYTSKGRKVAFNEKTETPNGTVTSNDISKLSRCKVVVSQSPDGLTTRTTKRVINSELLRSMPPEFSASKAVFTKQIVETIDLNDADKEAYMEASKLETELATETLKAQISNAKLQQFQAQQQMQAPPAPPPGAQPGAQQGPQGAPQQPGQQSMPSSAQMPDMMAAAMQNPI